jgi:hypothetical protein
LIIALKNVKSAAIYPHTWLINSVRGFRRNSEEKERASEQARERERKTQKEIASQRARERESESEKE